MRTFAVLLAAALSVPALAAPAAAASASPERRYIVQFAAGTPAQDGARELRARGANVERVLQHVFPGAVTRMSDQAAAALQRNPRVARVEADQVVRVRGTQSSAPWGLDRADQRGLPLDASFSYTAAGAGVDVYVVDTGIRADHVDLEGRVGTGYTAVADGRGTDDCNGHGTHVAGTAAGRVHGVAKAARLLPVRVLACDGSGTVSGLVAGLDWVTAHHAAGAPAVANLSLGGGASTALDTAVQATIADGVTVVVAAGNAGVDACGVSPARVAAAVTVGATAKNDARASFSNYGSCLDLFAPGVGIPSAWHTASTATATLSGTSMAAPHVAGAAAALLETEPGLSPAAVADRLVTTATSGVVTGAGTDSPNRLLWADPAHAAPAEPAPSEPVAEQTAPAAPADVTAAAGKRSASLRWTQGGDGGSAVTGQTVHVYKGGVPAGTVAVSAGATSAKIGRLTPGASYTFTVSATNAVGTSPQSAHSNPVVPRR